MTITAPARPAAGGEAPPTEGAGRWRWVKKFSWELVDPDLILALLKADGEKLEIPPDQLQVAAAQRFGPSGGKPRLIPHAGVLRDTWLPSAPASTVKQLALLVQHIVIGPDRWARIDSKDLALDFLQRRNLSKNLTTNIVKFFLADHKGGEWTLVTPRRPREPSVPRILQGHAGERPPPWRHQVETRKALESHLQEFRGEGALVVLPTGSGKTETLVDWLLDRLEKDPTARVLWIVHQQLLVDQAVDRFAACAAGRRKSFVRRARAIHGDAAEIATLTEPKLDIACITIQTLIAAVNSRKRSKLTRFLKRPTYVVVDEAHHAGSHGYTRVLDFILQAKPRCLIGLTATPWPNSIDAYGRFVDRFPKTIVNISPEELILQRILSRPVLHTVQTGLRLYLDSKELAAAGRADFSPQTLKRLDVAFRNSAVVRTWFKQRELWGKTLVFAVNIAHADALITDFRAAGADARVVHGRSPEDRTAVIRWFRAATGNAVLISVGMLNEGVDLPDAFTAFLARPTASRILLRQMIGRVLRGPAAGGSAEAHVVWFQDGWENFGEVLDPSIVVPTAVRNRVEADGREWTLHPLLDEEGKQIPLDLEAEIAITLASDAFPMMNSSRLIGYYDLVDRRVPVFAHQEAAFGGLLNTATSAGLRGRALLSWFDETHPPYPSQRGLVKLVDYTRGFGEPPFVPLDAIVGPGVAVDKILAGRLTGHGRQVITREVYETTFARTAYPTLERFEKAVEQELKAREGALGSVGNAVPASTVPGLKKRPYAPRDLEPPWNAALQKARVLLPPEIGERLADIPPIEVDWTQRVATSTWAHWSIQLWGKNAGLQIIKVNRLLRTDSSTVPDELLEYLLYHELLHHLLPGQGHDAEFNELEARWPDRDPLDLAFATFHERWNTSPKLYANEVGE